VSLEAGSEGPVAPGGRVEVVGGGAASAEELAALVVALTPVAGPAASPNGPGRRAVPAWTAAALREGVGGAAVVRPSDLRELDPHA
jgi:hypothetical protein